MANRILQENEIARLERARAGGLDYVRALDAVGIQPADFEQFRAELRKTLTAKGR